ncbi:hypothetical protein M440DRAFT_1387762 [Trichoderma longibrachiatum ATCC 18648]|uniref:MFS general substrate transporter n=1 Tax=Trichoderma longibrachiatum ATCC 18648 TaxID=983965 RepID=A0A2T4CIJ3_TRILO|nr:hypothetical protein M440DRAFT_1387762 [Trichoderma longibrachiatum ATCC 18648]
MAFGILEPSSGEKVPGTTHFYDDPSRPQTATEQDAARLKCDTSGKTPIILVPQPSDDPNDPLNWPLWKRDLVTFTLCWAGVLATSLGPILAANTVTLSRLLSKTFTKVALLTGYFLLGAGAAAIFFVPSGRYLTRKNRGVYEPEFRILLVIPMLIVGGIGLFGFAKTAGNVISGEFSYIVPLVFFGFEVAGMVIGAVASSLYIVDAYRDLTIEGFTLMIIFKNIFSFILTFFAYDWLITGGIERTMIAISIVQVVVCVISIPMYERDCRVLFMVN